MHLSVRLCVVACLSFSSLGCAGATVEALQELPVTTVPGFYDKAAGQRLRIRGYLFSDSSDAWFLRNKEGDRRKPGSRYVLVQRSALRILEDLSIVDPAEKCTDNYVELIGISGALPHGGIGVVKIELIRIYENEDFTGLGTICFSDVD